MGSFNSIFASVLPNPGPTPINYSGSMPPTRGNSNSINPRFASASSSPSTPNGNSNSNIPAQPYYNVFNSSNLKTALAVGGVAALAGAAIGAMINSADEKDEKDEEVIVPRPFRKRQGVPFPNQPAAMDKLSAKPRQPSMDPPRGATQKVIPLPPPPPPPSVALEESDNESDGSGSGSDNDSDDDIHQRPSNSIRRYNPPVRPPSNGYQPPHSNTFANPMNRPSPNPPALLDLRHHHVLVLISLSPSPFLSSTLFLSHFP